jgi:transcription elongation factor GreA
LVKYKLSEERLAELKEELRYLQTVREKEVAELIKEARSFGDLSENSEYDEAKTEQGKLYSKIAELKNVIDNAEVIKEAQINGKVVLGSTVTVIDLATNSEEEYKIVGSQEADPMNGMISEDSPFGSSLMGRTEGEEVTLEVPAGTLRFKILGISKKR